MMTLDLLATTVVLFAASVLLLRAGESRTLQRGAVTYALTFPANLDEAAVRRFLASLTGLLPPWWRRLLAQPVVSFETLADHAGISHRLVVPLAMAGLVESALQAHVPGIRVERVSSQPAQPTQAAEYHLTTNQRLLRRDAPGLSANLLATLQPLAEGEQAVVQWLVTAAGPVQPPRLANRAEPQPLLARTNELLDTSEAVAALRAKQHEALLLVTGRLGVRAQPARAISLLRQLESPWHATRAPGVQLRRRLLPGWLVAGRVGRRAVPLLRWPGLANVEEAAGLIGWPIGVTALPGLTLGGCRLLPVATAVPREGSVLGLSSFPGQSDRLVALDDQARRRHLAITGPTGVGKSTLLTQLVLQDAQAGQGITVIDPKGDLVEAIMERLPESRLDDVVLLDPADDERPVGFNPLSCSPATRELVVEQVLGIMHAIWQANWGPRTDDILRGALLSLSAVPQLTLCEVPVLLTDEAFRRRVLAYSDDPALAGFWATFGAWSTPDRTVAIAPVLNKLRALTMRPRLRGMLGQAQGAVDFPRLIAERRILLVNLAAGRIGTQAAHLLGALLFASLWDAVSAQALVPDAERMAHSAFIDEFQHVVNLPTPAETILAEARGYHLSLTLAHQHLGQLSADLEHAVLANARSKVVFQTSRADAGVFAKELGGGLTPEDLMGIAAFEAVTTVYAAGRVQPPATITSLALGEPLREVSVVRERSRLAHGVPRAEVEAALVERQRGSRRAAQPVGRSARRAS